MDADLDLLLIAVFCTADDLPLVTPCNARRIVTDAEVVTLCVAQAIIAITSDPRLVAVAAKRLTHLFPRGFYKRREALSDTIEALIDEFARHTPGYSDDALLVDSTPIESCRSRQTVKRGGASSLDDALANAADYGYCASHSRYFYGFRLHALFALDGTPRALALTGAKDGERDIALRLLARVRRSGHVTIIGDKGYAGRDVQARGAALNATIVRPRRTDEPGRGTRLTAIRQRIESIFWTAKDTFGIKRHGARTRLGRPPRAMTAYYA
jgi:hypothetical protein